MRVEILPIDECFASIGRLLAAIVQYHARYGELEKDNIEMIIQNYLDNFENALERRQLILKRDHWDDELEKLILLHAWDWALYWRQKKASIFPTKHFDEFIQQIKKFLGCNTVSTDPEDGNSSLKDTFPVQVPNTIFWSVCLTSYRLTLGNHRQGVRITSRCPTEWKIRI